MLPARHFQRAGRGRQRDVPASQQAKVVTEAVAVSPDSRRLPLASQSLPLIRRRFGPTQTARLQIKISVY